MGDIVYIAGSKRVTPEMIKRIQEEVQHIIDTGRDHIIIGDDTDVDAAVAAYCDDQTFTHYTVHSPRNPKARKGKNAFTAYWGDKKTTGFDSEMRNKSLIRMADYMIFVWDGKSSEKFCQEMVASGKPVTTIDVSVTKPLTVQQLALPEMTIDVRGGSMIVESIPLPDGPIDITSLTPPEGFAMGGYTGRGGVYIDGEPHWISNEYVVPDTTVEDFRFKFYHWLTDCRAEEDGMMNAFRKFSFNFPDNDYYWWIDDNYYPWDCTEQSAVMK